MGQQPRGEGGDGAAAGKSGSATAIEIKDLSEEEFYRVAVENIMAKERLGYGDNNGSVAIEGLGSGGDNRGISFEGLGGGGSASIIAAYAGDGDGGAGGSSSREEAQGINQKSTGSGPRRPKRIPLELGRKDAASIALRSGRGLRDGEMSARLRRRRKKVTAFKDAARAPQHGAGVLEQCVRLIKRSRLTHYSCRL